MATAKPRLSLFLGQEPTPRRPQTKQPGEVLHQEVLPEPELQYGQPQWPEIRCQTDVQDVDISGTSLPPPSKGSISECPVSPRMQRFREQLPPDMREVFDATRNSPRTSQYVHPEVHPAEEVVNSVNVSSPPRLPDGSVAGVDTQIGWAVTYSAGVTPPPKENPAVKKRGQRKRTGKAKALAPSSSGRASDILSPPSVWEQLFHSAETAPDNAHEGKLPSNFFENPEALSTVTAYTQTAAASSRTPREIRSPKMVKFSSFVKEISPSESFTSERND